MDRANTQRGTRQIGFEKTKQTEMGKTKRKDLEKNLKILKADKKDPTYA